MTWKDIPGYEGMYQVSDTGRVRSLPHTMIRSNGRCHSVKGKELKLSTNSNGYKCATIRRFTYPVYQLVMLAFRGMTPNGLEILHGPKGKSNDSLDNLSFGTHSANGLDMIRDGLESCKQVVGSDGSEFRSVNEAARYIGVDAGQLSKAIHSGWKCHGTLYKFKTTEMVA